MRSTRPSALRIELMAYDMSHPLEPAMSIPRLSLLSGLSVNKLQKWLRNEGDITERQAKRVAEALEIPHQDLLLPWQWIEEACPECGFARLAQSGERRRCVLCGMITETTETVA